MIDDNTAARAEELTRRRARALPVLAIILISQQASFFANQGGGDGSVDQVQAAAWLILSVVLLLFVWSGGGWIYPRAVRELADDEVTQANRKQAFRIGFLASMAGCIFLYFLSLFEPISGREAIHLIMTIGIGATLLRFGALERRALGDG